MTAQSQVGGEYGKFIRHVAVNQGGAAGTTVLVTADSGGRLIKVVSYIIVLSADGTLRFDSDAVPMTGAMTISAKGGVVAPAGKHPYLATGPGEELRITTTGGGANGHLSYVVER